MSEAGFGIGSIKKPRLFGCIYRLSKPPHARRSFVPRLHIQFTRYSNGECICNVGRTVAVHAISDVCKFMRHTDGLTFSLQYESALSSFCQFCRLNISEADMKLLYATSSIQ